ncbi:thioredoxin domain-containing protein 9-like [Watersipora subatra]|uniref:thioredoxin domain-containing protein 9-like n=1 Tax=Watersipora subatra TaxID=2589382 RepID=UPI00355B3F98
MDNILEQQLMAAAGMVEQQLDNEIERLDKMDKDELEELREKRIAAMKKAEDQKKKWIANGHGKYSEVPGEKEFFDECKKSKNVVCHFYREATMRCKIVDKHLQLLAPQHIECRFLKIDAEKSKFLTDRLKVRVLPTIVILRDNKTVDFIVGFDDLGGVDDFSTEMMEWRIARADVLNYSGDLLTPPGADNHKSKNVLFDSKKKTIRGRGDDTDSEDDW